MIPISFISGAIPASEKANRLLPVVICLLAFLVSASGQTSSTQTSSFQFGDKTIVIPAPDGFEEAASQFAELRNQMSATEDPGNDMLAVHLPGKECDRLRRGQSGGYNFYTKISVSKANRTHEESEEAFAHLIAGYRKSGSEVMDMSSPMMKATLDRLDQTLQDIAKSDAKLEMSQPVNLGEMDTRPNVYSVLYSVTVAVENKGQRRAQPVLAGLTFVRVNQRLVYVYTYRGYTAKADIEIMQDFTKKWITKILAAN